MGRETRGEARKLQPCPLRTEHIFPSSKRSLSLSHTHTHFAVPHFPIVHRLGQFTRPPHSIAVPSCAASTLFVVNCFSAGDCPLGRKWPTFLSSPPVLSFFPSHATRRFYFTLSSFLITPALCSWAWASQAEAPFSRPRRPRSRQQSERDSPR